VCEPQHGSGPAHILLHVEHARLALDVEAAGVEAHSLSDQRDLGMIRLTPGEIDQPRRARGRASDRMNEGKILLEEIISDYRSHRGAMALGKRTGGLFKLGWAHVVGRSVDEVACEKDAFDNAAKLLSIDIARQFQPNLLVVVLAIAAKPV